MRILFLALAVLALACNKQSEPPPASAPSAPAAPPPSAAPAAPAAAPAAAEAPAADAPKAGGLTWKHSAPFERREPKSQMRIAEYGIEGDELSELTVFYFGPDQG